MTRMLRTDTPNSGFIFRARVHHHRRRPPPRVGDSRGLDPESETSFSAAHLVH